MGLRRFYKKVRPRNWSNRTRRRVRRAVGIGALLLSAWYWKASIRKYIIHGLLPNNPRLAELIHRVSTAVSPRKELARSLYRMPFQVVDDMVEEAKQFAADDLAGVITESHPFFDTPEIPGNLPDWEMDSPDLNLYGERRVRTQVMDRGRAMTPRNLFDDEIEGWGKRAARRNFGMKKRRQIIYAPSERWLVPENRKRYYPSDLGRWEETKKFKYTKGKRKYKED